MSSMEQDSKPKSQRCNGETNEDNKKSKAEELQTLNPSFLRRGWGRRQPLKNFKPNQGSPPLSSPARWLRPAKVQASQVSSQLTSLSGERELLRRRIQSRRLFQFLETMHNYSSRRTQESDMNVPNMGFWDHLLSRIRTNVHNVCSRRQTMDCKIGSFQLPPAALGTFDTASVIIWVPLYDMFLVPLA
ncbi:Proton-dependent oligopeptide transporter family protein [Raphanus sativus]|nr:Proton-dependent oligopeptide transporter family protein [Raphanus sativus]